MTATQLTKERRRARANRLVRLEQLYNQGLTSPTELSAAFGVCVPVIIRDIKCVERDILRRSRRGKRKQRNRRIAQLDSILFEARNAFTRSREEVLVEWIPCEECDTPPNGEQPVVPVGAPGDPPCKFCSGRGGELKNTTTHDGPGDSAFLRIAVQAIKESGKLDGLYERKAGGSKSHAELSLINNIHVSTPLEGDTTNPYHGAPAEMLIEARAALQRIREAITTPPSTMKTIDATAKPTED